MNKPIAILLGKRQSGNRWLIFGAFIICSIITPEYWSADCYAEGSSNSCNYTYSGDINGTVASGGFDYDELVGGWYFQKEGCFSGFLYRVIANISVENNIAGYQAHITPGVRKSYCYRNCQSGEGSTGNPVGEVSTNGLQTSQTQCGQVFTQEWVEFSYTISYINSQNQMYPFTTMVTVRNGANEATSDHCGVMQRGSTGCPQ